VSQLRRLENAVATTPGGAIRDNFADLMAIITLDLCRQENAGAYGRCRFVFARRTHGLIDPEEDFVVGQIRQSINVLSQQERTTSRDSEYLRVGEEPGEERREGS